MASSRRQARSESHENDSQIRKDSSDDSNDEQYDTDPTEPDFVKSFLTARHGFPLTSLK
jgi:hypothetical protein